MNLKEVKIIMQSLQQNKAIQNKYKDVYKKIKSFLKKQKKKDNKQQKNKIFNKQLKTVIESAFVKINKWVLFSAFSYSLVNNFILNYDLFFYICNDFNRFN